MEMKMASAKHQEMAKRSGNGMKCQRKLAKAAAKRKWQRRQYNGKMAAKPASMKKEMANQRGISSDGVCIYINSIYRHIVIAKRGVNISAKLMAWSIAAWRKRKRSGNGAPGGSMK
jgi:hypothetical protein